MQTQGRAAKAEEGSAVVAQHGGGPWPHAAGQPSSTHPLTAGCKGELVAPITLLSLETLRNISAPTQ